MNLNELYYYYYYIATLENGIFLAGGRGNLKAFCSLLHVLTSTSGFTIDNQCNSMNCMKISLSSSPTGGLSHSHKVTFFKFIPYIIPYNLS
jgi:hypothetical protein